MSCLFIPELGILVEQFLVLVLINANTKLLKFSLPLSLEVTLLYQCQRGKFIIYEYRKYMRCKVVVRQGSEHNIFNKEQFGH